MTFAPDLSSFASWTRLRSPVLRLLKTFEEIFTPRSSQHTHVYDHTQAPSDLEWLFQSADNEKLLGMWLSIMSFTQTGITVLSSQTTIMILGVRTKKERTHPTWRRGWGITRQALSGRRGRNSSCNALGVADLPYYRRLVDCIFRVFRGVVNGDKHHRRENKRINFE